ncbi:helix-turn-helix domain-containing protein [Rhodospirillum sp. A1_3_36]|uniref:helix-turn-helix domain-containing protein n=1 Tax=Rhodospirillum sp. A1_3_36 TaxID=3391666 RepID=UPI0039A4C689
MNTKPCQSGRARRSDTFPDLERRARGATAHGVTTASVTGLVLKGVKVLQPALSPAAVHLLALLCEHVYGDDRWKRGKLLVKPGNARLAVMLGVTERAVRRLLTLLEDNHWIIRRYNAANRRAHQAGIDLAPVAARLHDLREAVTFAEEELRETRRRAEELVVEGTDGWTDASSQGDRSFRLESLTGNPKFKKTSVQGEGRDRDLLLLMVTASPRLQESLRGEDLNALLYGDPPPQALNQVARAVSYLAQEMGLPRGIWGEGLARHGFPALAAAVVSAERQGVTRRAGYLRSMLARGNLGETVGHSLRVLAGGRGA